MILINIDNCKYRIISYEQLNELQKYNNIILIDVRSRQEFIEGHIKEAINIPLMEIRKYKFNKNQVIVLYCNAGIRSVKAGRILESKGYKDIYVLEPTN